MTRRFAALLLVAWCACDGKEPAAAPAASSRRAAEAPASPAIATIDASLAKVVTVDAGVAPVDAPGTPEQRRCIEALTRGLERASAVDRAPTAELEARREGERVVVASFIIDADIRFPAHAVSVAPAKPEEPDRGWSEVAGLPAWFKRLMPAPSATSMPIHWTNRHRRSVRNGLEATIASRSDDAKVKDLLERAADRCLASWQR